MSDGGVTEQGRERGKADRADLVAAREVDRQIREGQEKLAIRQWSVEIALARAYRRGPDTPTPIGDIVQEAEVIEAYLRGGSTA